MAGKGSRARPLSVSKSKFDDNWDRIFGKKENTVKELDVNNDKKHTDEVISNSRGSHAEK